MGGSSIICCIMAAIFLRKFNVISDELGKTLRKISVYALYEVHNKVES